MEIHKLKASNIFCLTMILKIFFYPTVCYDVVHKMDEVVTSEKEITVWFLFSKMLAPAMLISSIR